MTGRGDATGNGAPLKLFALEGGRAYGQRVAGALGIELAAHEEREFEWGQHKCRPLESVRGADVYVVESLHGEAGRSVNDRLCRLLFFLGALRDAGPARLTAVVPFLCYARKDRRTKARDPVTTRYVAMLFEAMGIDRIVTVEAHDLAAFQNAFRCPTEHLDARRLVADFVAREHSDATVAVVSPDLGGVKRANGYREAIARRLAREVTGAVVEKFRSDDEVTGGRVVGDVRGRLVVLVDDMISGGTTLARAAEACRAAGATAVVAVAAHGTFAPGAAATLAAAPLDRIVVLDHVPPAELGDGPAARKLHVLDGAGLVAEAISRLYGHGSLTDLLEP